MNFGRPTCEHWPIQVAPQLVEAEIRGVDAGLSILRGLLMQYPQDCGLWNGVNILLDHRSHLMRLRVPPIIATFGLPPHSNN